jgi:sporulation protein YlmC with PRC-barrel domain
VAVLLNEGSAPGSEIIAAALEQQDCATLVGEPTFGTTTSKSRIELPQGGGLRLTTDRWFTLKHKSVAGTARRTRRCDRRAGRNAGRSRPVRPTLDRAIELLRAGWARTLRRNGSLPRKGSTTMDTTTTTRTLQPLSESDLMVADPAEDIRDRTVFDRNGDEVGRVDDLLIDGEESKVRFIRLGAGGFLGIGEDHFLIPVDAITGIDERGVHIDQTREHVAGGPKYQPELATDVDYYGDVYGHYGYGPYWGTGYAYPAYPYYPAR